MGLVQRWVHRRRLIRQLGQAIREPHEALGQDDPVALAAVAGDIGTKVWGSPTKKILAAGGQSALTLAGHQSAGAQLVANRGDHRDG
jgi:hypothetical protein